MATAVAFAMMAFAATVAFSTTVALTATVTLTTMTFATMTFAAFAFTAVSVATAASSVAFSAHELCHSCHFLGSSLAALSYLTLEVECLASQRMVEVYFHLAVTDFQYHTIEAVAVLVLQRNDSAYLYVLCVKLAVDGEDFLL